MAMKRIAALTVILLLSAGFAWAGPMVPKDIGADAKWFGHVDFEAIHSMKLVQDLKDKCPAHERWQAKMKELSVDLGMNPMEDVLGVTLYSNHYGGHIGVGLFYVKNLDRQKMLNFLKEKHPDHQTSEYGSRTLYTWTVKHQGQKMELTGTFASDTLVAIGADAEMVKTALDVLDGKKPGLTKDAPLLHGIPEMTLFASRGIDVPEEYRKTTKCPVLHNCKAATAFWTEKDGQIEGKYEFATVSEATAKNFKTVVDGFKAMGELRFSDIPAVKKMMDGLTIETQGESFTATYKASTEDVEAAAKAMMEQKMECPFFGKHHGPREKHGGEKK
jgi:hypothetical protein